MPAVFVWLLVHVCLCECVCGSGTKRKERRSYIKAIRSRTLLHLHYPVMTTEPLGDTESTHLQIDPVKSLSHNLNNIEKTLVVTTAEVSHFEFSRWRK